MTKRFDLIVFDWDGTLADSTALIVHAIQAAFAEAGRPVPSREAASFVIGYALPDAMRYLAPDASDRDLALIMDGYRAHYLARDGEIALFEGVAAALARYKEAGHWLAVATGKSRRGLDRALSSVGFSDLFDITRCADECHSKPHPQMLHEIGDYLGVIAGRTVMIGDTTHDLQMAGNAGTAALGVGYGAHPRAELEALAPLAVFDSFAELDRWLNENG
ncbi:HAD-IA family hydrolase [Chitinimonas lacunae]|uniref:HAD-IA family hydrolase n=1 Tax=Chitinimonas lacunae TaxID=1963018 RepID=A0ABV8MQ64_9NEIS